MTHLEAIINSHINIFDLIHDKKSKFGISIYTYRKPGETDDDFYERDNRNFEKALRLHNAHKK